MGLLAIVAAQARRVDLLPRIVKALPWISILCFIAGLANLAWLPTDGQYRNTYFSENALLAHQAVTFFRETEWDILRGFKGQVELYNHTGVPEIERNTEIADIFHDFGLQPYVHHWETLDGQQSGQNFYAMHTASRGPHNEAIVVAAPWLVRDGEFNVGGVSLLISLARFFQRWNFWHKNLIFVISSNADVALRQFVDAYHSSLQYTAGSIEGAVVLDYAFDSEFFDHVDICFEGLNGQLPNLDLLNVAVFSASAEFAKVTTLGLESAPEYRDRLTSLTRHVWQQISAGINHNRCGSSMFSGWRIDAVTLRAVQGNSWYDITTLGRVCESTVRSINNLLEHFHQSFFFYLLLSPSNFVSIASFLPTAMLASSSFSIMALYRLALARNITPKSIWRTITILVTLLLVCSGGAQVHSAEAAVIFFAVLGVASLLLSSRLTVTEKSLLNAMALALVGLELTTLGMVNMSLALGLSIACIPLAWVRPGGNPVINFSLASLAGPITVLSALAVGALNTTFMGLLSDLVWGWRELNVWTWALVTAIWIPLWAVCLACT